MEFVLSWWDDMIANKYRIQHKRTIKREKEKYKNNYDIIFVFNLRILLLHESYNVYFVAKNWQLKPYIFYV